MPSTEFSVKSHPGVSGILEYLESSWDKDYPYLHHKCDLQLKTLQIQYAGKIPLREWAISLGSEALSVKGSRVP